MSNSTQGLAILVFLVAFVCLSVALFEDGDPVILLLFLSALGASLGLFQKARSTTIRSR